MTDFNWDDYDELETEDDDECVECGHDLDDHADGYCYECDMECEGF